MKTPTTLVMLRDLALLAGGVAISALAAHELADGTRLRPAAGPSLPDVENGWLYTVARYGESRPQRVRPATVAEAAASAASRTAGHGGYLGLTEAGDVIAPGDPRYLAGTGRWTGEHGHVELVFVDGGPTPIVAGALLAEADAVLAGEVCTCGPTAGADPWCPVHPAGDPDADPEAASEALDDTAAPTV